MAPPTQLCLQAIPEHKDEAFLSKRWEDFNHSQKFNLGGWGSAWSVRDRETNQQLVLQSCPQPLFNRARYRLLESARKRADLFATPKHIFFRQDRVFVCSEMAGISLAEVIDGTILLTEAQVSTIMKKVIIALQISQRADVAYLVKALNVFLCSTASVGKREIAVRLGFGSHLQPEELDTHHLEDCRSVGNLLYHMLTRYPRILEPQTFSAADQMIVIRTQSADIPVHIHHQLSSMFFDFIDTCMSEGCSLDKLSKHAFLKKDDVDRLSILVEHVKDSSIMGDLWSQIASGQRRGEEGQRKGRGEGRGETAVKS